MAANPTIQCDHPQSVSRALVPLLAIASMLAMLNNVVLGPLMPAISDDLSVSYPVLGQVTAAVFFGAAIVGLFAGPLSDQFGRKRLVVFGLVVVAVSAAGSAAAPSFGWLFGIRLTSAISGGMMAGTTMAIAGTMFNGVERRKAIGAIASGMAAAPIIGIPTLTTIASMSSWRVSMLVVTAAAVVLAVMAQRIVPFDAVSDAGRIEIRKFMAAYAPLARDRTMLTLFGANLTRAIGWVGLLTYLGAYWAEQHGLSVREIGWTMMFLGIWYFVGTRAGGHLTSISLRPLFGTATFLCAICFGTAIAAPVDLWTAILFLSGAAVTGGIGFVAITAIASNETHAGQGTTMSLNGAMFAFGSALGGAFGGGLLAAGGYGALGLGLMGFMMLAGVTVWHPAWIRIPAFGRTAASN
jgi:predicted MFS family arabinose efflux permease